MSFSAHEICLFEYFTIREEEENEGIALKDEEIEDDETRINLNK